MDGLRTYCGQVRDRVFVCVTRLHQGTRSLPLRPDVPTGLLCHAELHAASLAWKGVCQISLSAEQPRPGTIDHSLSTVLTLLLLLSMQQNTISDDRMNSYRTWGTKWG